MHWQEMYDELLKSGRFGPAPERPDFASEDE